jgi:L-fuconolactonase
MAGGKPAWGSVQAPDYAFLARALPEVVLEPDLAIIDAHQHLWRLFDEAPYLAPECAADIAVSGHRVEASVYVECNAFWRKDGPDHLRPAGEMEFAAGQAAMATSGRYGDRRIADVLVGWADLRLGDKVAPALAALYEASNGSFRGIRQRAKWDADPAVRGQWTEDAPELYLDAKFRKGFRHLSWSGFSFDASVFHPQIPEVTALARAFPTVEIALNHMGSPLGHGAYAGRLDETHADWLTHMRELATCPNVSVKLGGLLMNLANYDFTRAERPLTSEELAGLWRPYLEPCLDLFGPERCMVSSNFPVDKVGFPYCTVWNMFKRLTAGCSDDEKRWIFSDTAKRFYRMS